MNSLREYTPSAERPWDRAAAAHLLRRAGFTPSEGELRVALEAGPRATAERVLSDEPDCAAHNELDEFGASLAIRDDIAALRGWWLLRMCRTARPLHARLSVLWHNHFATSNAKVSSAALMLRQLRTIEQHALGSFERMLLAISRDPAMIVWLDGNENIKGRPNENFAREFFELFTLGVGNYTERDIQEAARAFTGWHERNGRFRFTPLEHDTGEKHVFERRGNFNGEDVVAATIAHPACATFVATKLLREFLCPDPPTEIADALADVLRGSKFDIRDALRALLSSEVFFDPRWRRVRIKSPVEYAVGIARSLEMRTPAAPLAEAVSNMGQRLFEPPSVKGWNGQRAWLNSATMLVRLNVAAAAAQHEGLDPVALLDCYEIADEDEARFCIELTLDGETPDAVQRELSQLTGGRGQRMRTALHLLMSCPEYQLA